MEYTIIIGFVMIILIPLMIIYAEFSDQTRDQVVMNELYQVARLIGNEIETVYFIGDPARTEIKVYMPSDVANASLVNQEIVFQTTVYGGRNDVVVPTKVSMNGSLPTTKGIHYLVLTAKGNWVEVRMK